MNFDDGRKYFIKRGCGILLVTVIASVGYAKTPLPAKNAAIKAPIRESTVSDNLQANDQPLVENQTVLDDAPLDAQTREELAADYQVTNVPDRFEKINRAMFSLNDTLDTYFLRPVATLYNKIIPKPLNKGIHNVFLNIGNFPTIYNDILQLHFYQMANDMWRLAINTTLGIGGLFDVAANCMGLPPYTNDFGLTLAHYGWDCSTFIVLPFWGPSSIRDAFSMPIDYFGFSIYPAIQPPRVQYAVYGLGVVDRRAQLLQFQPVFEAAALDKYVFIRNAYLQQRAYQIEQTKKCRPNEASTLGCAECNNITENK